MALTLSVSPSIPALVPSDYVPSLSVSSLDTLPDVGFGSQVTVTVTTILGDTTTLSEGSDYSYNAASDEVYFYHPITNSDTIQFSVTPDYSVTDLSTQFSDLGVAPAEGSNLRDKQLLQMARDLDARILALGGQGAGGGTSAGVSSLVVGDTSYDGTIQLFAGTGLSFLEGANSFQIELDANIRNAPSNITTLSDSLSDLDGEVDTLTTTVGNIRQVPDATSATIGHVLTVNNSNEPAWQAVSGGGGGGGATVINDLNDVVLSTLTDGDILVASGGDFVNQAPSFLTSGDVGAAALDNEYSSLSSLPTIPSTTGGWAFTTDRGSDVIFNAPNNETLASGYVWRWTGSQFKPAQLDISDINAAGNQALTDLIDGDREPVLEYGISDADKVLGVSNDGSSLEWVSQSGGSSSGPDVWQAVLDKTDASTSRGDYANTNRWDWGTLTDTAQLQDPVEGWTEDITLGTSLGSLAADDIVFTVTSTGTYRVKYDLTVAGEDSGDFSYHAMDVALLRKTTSIINGTLDDVLIRSPYQNDWNDSGTAGADVTLSFSAEKYIELDASDEIYLYIIGQSDGNSEVGALYGNWIIEKVG